MDCEAELEPASQIVTQKIVFSRIKSVRFKTLNPSSKKKQMRPMLPRLAGLLRGRPSAGAFRSTAVRYFSSAGGTTGHRAFALTGVVAAGAAGLSLWAGCGHVSTCVALQTQVNMGLHANTS